MRNSGEACRHDRQGQEVVLLADAQATNQRQRRHPRQVRIRHVRQPLLATGDGVPLEADAPHDLGEGEGQHREVDTGEADAEVAEYQRHQPGQKRRAQQADRERHAVRLHQDGAGVGADAEVGGMPEGDQPGVAEQQVEAGCKQGQDDDVGREESVETGAHPGNRRHREQHERHPGNPLDPSAMRCRLHRSIGLPNKPQGRTTRITAISTKAAKMEKRGKMRMPKASTWP